MQSSNRFRDFLNPKIISYLSWGEVHVCTHQSAYHIYLFPRAKRFNKENLWKQKFRCGWKSWSDQFMSLCTLDFLFQWDLPVKSVFHGELEWCAFDRLLLWHQLPKLLPDSFGLRMMGSYAFRLTWLQSSCLQICCSIQYNTDLVMTAASSPIARDAHTQTFLPQNTYQYARFHKLDWIGRAQRNSVPFSNTKEVKFSI